MAKRKGFSLITHEERRQVAPRQASDTYTDSFCTVAAACAFTSPKYFFHFVYYTLPSVRK